MKIKYKYLESLFHSKQLLLMEEVYVCIWIYCIYLPQNSNLHFSNSWVVNGVS